MPHSMLDTAQATIRQAAARLGYDEKLIDALLEAKAEHVFEVEAGGKKYPAYRVQHNNTLGPYKGGIRFHPHVSLNEVRALATLMSLKTAAVGLPLGGGKGGVAVDPRALSKIEVEQLARAYSRHLAPHIGPDKDIPAPDVNTNAETMDWMVDEYERITGDTTKASFTGKSMSGGGSEGRQAATGRGGVMALIEYLRATDQSEQPMTVAIQGFGNVGYYFAEVLRDYPHLNLIAISNSKHTWVVREGIDITKHTASGLPRPEDITDLSSAEVLPNDAIISIEADILVLAALEDSITDANVNQVKATLLVELANGPITTSAAEKLGNRQVVILPDVIANAGGVIVSYLEWRQNMSREHWDEPTVNRKLERLIVSATHTMMQHAEEHHISYKQAAFELALQRLLPT